MPYTPVGLFEDWSQEDLDALKVSAKEALIGGRIVNVSEPGTSYGKTYDMRAQDCIAEIRYAEKQRRGGIVRQTRPDFSRTRGRGGADDYECFNRGGGY